jgi:hypothetical protein
VGERDGQFEGLAETGTDPVHRRTADAAPRVRRPKLIIFFFGLGAFFVVLLPVFKKVLTVSTLFPIKILNGTSADRMNGQGKRGNKYSYKRPA